MANLYYDHAAEPTASTLPLEGIVRADVAVVGGGFTGLSTALHLAELGAQVVLLEAHKPGWGASGRNGGQVNPGLKFDPDTVERDHGELGVRMNALSASAPAFVFDLIKRHRISCEARQLGTVRAATNAKQVIALRNSLEQWTRRSAPVEWLKAADIAMLTGTNRYKAGLLDRRGGDLNPLSFARGLAGVAQRAGATLHGDSRVLGMRREGAGWTLSTARGSVQADRVVLATNGYTDNLWPGLRCSLVPVFGAIAATVPLSAAVLAQVMPSRAVLYEIGAVTVYYRIDAGGRLLIGGRGPMHEVQSPNAIPHLLNYANRLWPALGGSTWSHAWGGRLAMTRDQYPHVHEPASGVLVCLGFNGRGIAMATTLGAALANRLVHSTPLDMPVSPVKPIALHALWPLAVRAAIARGRVSDFLGF